MQDLFPFGTLSNSQNPPQEKRGEIRPMKPQTMREYERYDENAKHQKKQGKPYKSP